MLDLKMKLPAFHDIKADIDSEEAKAILSAAVFDSSPEGLRREVGRYLAYPELRLRYALPIEAETDDDAAEFYRKCGFEAVAIRKFDVRRWICTLPVLDGRSESGMRADL